MVYIICRFLLRILYFTIFRFRAYGTHHIPAEGPVILCSNHISVLDPPTVGIALNRKVHFMAKAELFRIPLFGRLIRTLGAFPVNRGGVSRESIRLALQLLQDGNVMGVFPEGTRAAAGSAGKKGAASLALKSGAVVIPVTIVGSYAPFKGIKVVYGAPVDLSAFAGQSSSEALEQATELIMSRIRAQQLSSSKSSHHHE